MRIRPEIFDFEPDLGLKLGQTKPNISGTVPTKGHTSIPNDSGPSSACFDEDPKLFNCEIAQPSHGNQKGPIDISVKPSELIWFGDIDGP